MLVSLKFSQFCTRVFYDPHYVCLQETTMQASYQDTWEHTETIQCRLVHNNTYTNSL